MSPLVKSLFPFVRWFPMSKTGLRADLFSGITVALVLVPQSMAYAQLAGLPVVYGLYAAFIPVIIAALWGSSSQLHTGPVAMLSLMSAAALIPLATPGSTLFIELAIMLALMVGVLRFLLGVFRLGAIVNFLSSPVIVGFTNAAALIIGLSQLSKLIGVPFPRTDIYILDLLRVFSQILELHWPTVFFAVGAFALIAGLRRVMPILPGILIAVVSTTFISAVIGYEDKSTVDSARILAPETAELIRDYDGAQARIRALAESVNHNNHQADELARKGDIAAIGAAATLRSEVVTFKFEMDALKSENIQRRLSLHSHPLEGGIDATGSLAMFAPGAVPDGFSADGKTWRYVRVSEGQAIFSAGGAVVGAIPDGLPQLSTPTIHWSFMLALLPAAFVMALIGFMEATSISRAIATTTGERLNTSRELVGQGLGNIAGSFFGSYTVSGSFSRSAVAARSGAVSGLSAIISAMVVMIVLLFLTDYLYHLPQAVLAVIVMMAVFSLVRIAPLVNAWKVDRIGASIGVITFVATLAMAPSIANGILLGVGLTMLHNLIQIMKPRTEIVARKKDGTLGGVRAHGLKLMSECFIPVRFDGSLVFVNVAYFEDMILEANSEHPSAKAILIIGSSINDIDASGIEKIREVAGRLDAIGVKLVFSGLKNQVMKLIKKSGLYDELGQEAFYSDKQTALESLFEIYGKGDTDARTGITTCAPAKEGATDGR